MAEMDKPEQATSQSSVKSFVHVDPLLISLRMKIVFVTAVATAAFSCRCCCYTSRHVMVGVTALSE
jgi:hypothetical protein